MSAYISQLPVEVVIKPSNPNVKLSQYPIEVIYTLVNNSRLEVSQLALEVIKSYIASSGKKKYGPFTQCV